MVKMDLPDNIADVAVGSLHGCAITTDGAVYTWGDNRTGCLGLGHTKTCTTPMKVPLNFPVASACCTKGQPNPKFEKGPGQEGPRTHLVAKDGSLWIAGTAHKGLGADCLYKTLYPQTDIWTFYRVGGKAQDTRASTQSRTGSAEQLDFERLGMHPCEWGKDGDTHYLEKRHIVQSCNAHIHSMCLSSTGEVYTWGCGSDGRLGLRYFFKANGTKRNLKCYVSSPSRVESLEGKHVKFIACGKYWSFAIV